MSHLGGWLCPPLGTDICGPRASEGSWSPAHRVDTGLGLWGNLVWRQGLGSDAAIGTG